MTKWKEKTKGEKLFWRFGIAVVIILGLTSIPYFCIFNNGLSESTDDWQAFGEYAGAIFALLAVVGALFALYQTIGHSQDTTTLAEETNKLSKDTRELAKVSNEKYIESEERSIFFKQLELFRDTTYKIISPLPIDAVGLKLIACFAEQLKANLMAYYLFPLILNNETEDFVQELIERVKKKDNIDKEEKKAKGLDYYPPLEKIKLRIDAINRNPVSHEITNHLNRLRVETPAFLSGIALEIVKNIDIYEKFVVNEIAKEIRVNNFERFYRAVNYAAYAQISHHEAELGNYFRNIYYCLDMIRNFDNNIPNSAKNKQSYFMIFRAQLTRYELAILFYNYVGPKSHIETMVSYEDIEMFTNLNLKDLLIYCEPFEDERAMKEMVVSNLALIHKERLMAKKNKSGDTIPLFADLYKEFIPYQFRNIDC